MGFISSFIGSLLGVKPLEGIMSSTEDVLEKENELRKKYEHEMDRTFQRANRRIQNLNAAGIVSPALNGIDGYTGNPLDGSQYTKFTRSGHDWEFNKMQYGKAIAFLNQPTSTVRGYKAYENYVMEKAQLPKNIFQKYSGRLIDLLMSYGNNHGNVFPYRDSAKQEDDEERMDVSAQMEADAMDAEDDIQMQFDSELDDLLNGTDSDKDENSLGGIFSDFFGDDDSGGMFKW